jgi:hypothetical protein
VYDGSVGGEKNNTYDKWGGGLTPVYSFPAGQQQPPMYYDVLPEEQQQQQHQQRNRLSSRAGSSAYEANTTKKVPIVYAVPADDGPGEYATMNNSMYEPTQTGGGAAANVRRPMVDGNNTYDMQVPGKKSKGAAAATSARIAREGGGGAVIKCTRPSPAGGTCKHTALPGGGQFCTLHTCPECSAGKSGSAPGCLDHLTSTREQTAGWKKQPEQRVIKKVTSASAGGGIQRNATTRQGSTYEGFGEEQPASSTSSKIRRNAKKGSTYDGFGEGDGASDETLV